MRGDWSCRMCGRINKPVRTFCETCDNNHSNLRFAHGGIRISSGMHVPEIRNLSTISLDYWLAGATGVWLFSSSTGWEWEYCDMRSCTTPSRKSSYNLHFIWGYIGISFEL